jgi:GTP-binding protein Era
VLLSDTVGFIRDLPHHLVASFRATLEEAIHADLLLHVVDAASPDAQAQIAAVESVLNDLGVGDKPLLLLLNKIDALKDKRALLELTQGYQSLHGFQEYLPLSARTGEGVETLVAEIVKRLPEGPAYFPEDYLTDQPERFLASELVREQILKLTREEVPHSVAVVVDSWQEKRAVTRVSVTIFVERETQKAIVIGAGGAMLKQVGSAARRQMEAIFGRKVFLELFVKTRERWRENPEFLNAVDWRSGAGPGGE